MAANGNFWVRLPTPLKRLIAASFEQAPLVAPQHPAQNTRILPAAAANQTWKCVPHGAVDSDGYVRYGFADGAEGLVNVWCLVDNATQHIIDRVVIKQVHPGQVAFSDPLNWTLGAVGGQPREARMSDNVTNNLLPGDRMHVASCLGYGDVRGNPRWRYRLYFEFAEEGNLRDLIMRQRANNKTTRKLGQKTFPEPFLWMLLEALAKVAVAMDNAGVLHGDLHPGNIFLGAPNATRFAMYPVPKVADFGSTRLIASNVVQLRTATLLNDACHPLYQPPELSRNQNGTVWEFPSPAPSSRTNVWQIGMIMACCMRLRPYLPESRWRCAQRHWEVSEAQQLRFTGATGVLNLPRNKLVHGNSRYSAELIDIVANCLQSNHATRYTANTLAGHVAFHSPNVFRGTNTYVPGRSIRRDMQRYKIRRPLGKKYRAGSKLT